MCYSANDFERWLNPIVDSAVKINDSYLARVKMLSADGVITTDILGNVTSINPMAESITGWKQKEALGKPIEHIFQTEIDKKTSETSKKPLKDILECGNTKHVVNRLKFMDKNKNRKKGNSGFRENKDGAFNGNIFRDVPA